MLFQVWEFRNEIASLNRIIQYSGTPSHPGVLSWKVRIYYLMRKLKQKNPRNIIYQEKWQLDEKSD